MSGRAELLSIIVPVYNEVATSRAVLDRLLAVHLPLPREIVVVDDGSTDGTAQVLDAAVDEHLPLVVFHAERNGGKGTAIRFGLQHARGSIIAIQDADLELDPQQLADLVEPILRGTVDVVYGSRFLRGRAGAPLVTFVANRILTGVTNLLFGASLTDMETCYKVMRVDVARSLELSADRFDIEPQITARLLRRGYRIHERPIRFEPRSRPGKEDRLARRCACDSRARWRAAAVMRAFLVALVLARFWLSVSGGGPLSQAAPIPTAIFTRRSDGRRGGCRCRSRWHSKRRGRTRR